MSDIQNTNPKKNIIQILKLATCHGVQVGEIPVEPFQSRVGMYVDNFCGVVNYIGSSMDLLFSHLKIKRSVNMSK